MPLGLELVASDARGVGEVVDLRLAVEAAVAADHADGAADLEVKAGEEGRGRASAEAADGGQRDEAAKVAADLEVVLDLRRAFQLAAADAGEHPASVEEVE